MVRLNNCELSLVWEVHYISNNILKTNEFQFLMVVRVKAMSSGSYHQTVLKVVTNVAERPAASMFRVHLTSTI